MILWLYDAQLLIHRLIFYMCVHSDVVRASRCTVYVYHISILFKRPDFTYRLQMQAHHNAVPVALSKCQFSTILTPPLDCLRRLLSMPKTWCHIYHQVHYLPLEFLHLFLPCLNLTFLFRSSIGSANNRH